MTTIITRAGKGSGLTYTEMDNNFSNLNADKAENSDLISTASGKGAELVGVTGESGKTMKDLFDGGHDVDIKPKKVLAKDGLGVGNAISLVSTVSGDTSLALEIFDENGSSIGYIPVYQSTW